MKKIGKKFANSIAEQQHGNTTMSSVWAQLDRREQPKKLAGFLSDDMAKLIAGNLALNAMAAHGTKHKVSVIRDGLEWFLFVDGMFYGSIWVEPCSPPSESDGFDNRRAQAAP